MVQDGQVVHQMLRPLFLLVTLIATCCAETEYFAVCDAGSTGTRLYVFQVDTAAAKASSIFVKKVKPGLSSYAENPSEALPPLLNLLMEGSLKLPEEVRNTTPLSIFGTAGMRLLPSEKQAGVWESVMTLRSDPSFPFESVSLQARTVSGSEEGLWAVLTTNFLTGRMSHDLTSNGEGAPFGLMDLGGSSTQIAIPATTAAQKGYHLPSNATVHSYLGFGMTYIREQVRKQTSGGKDAGCYMKGADVADGLAGSGDASACRVLIRELMSGQSKTCQGDAAAEKPCLGDLSQVPEAVQAIQGQVEFYAVAGLTYVVDFVRWWLELNPSSATTAGSFLKAYPKPSISELQSAVDAMCAGDYAPVAERTADKKRAHSFTGADNAPYRCFQANYILVLLGDMYGFPTDGRSVTFALDVEGEDLEWPLGAMLHQKAYMQQWKQVVEATMASGMSPEQAMAAMKNMQDATQGHEL